MRKFVLWCISGTTRIRKEMADILSVTLCTFVLIYYFSTIFPTQASDITLSSFIIRHTQDKDLAILMSAIAISCKSITRAVRKAGIAGLYGLAGTENTTGDAVKKLDVLSNDIMIKTLEVRTENDISLMLTFISIFEIKFNGFYMLRHPYGIRPPPFRIHTCVKYLFRRKTNTQLSLKRTNKVCTLKFGAMRV